MKFLWQLEKVRKIKVQNISINLKFIPNEKIFKKILGPYEYQYT